MVGKMYPVSTNGDTLASSVGDGFLTGTEDAADFEFATVRSRTRTKEGGKKSSNYDERDSGLDEMAL